MPIPLRTDLGTKQDPGSSLVLSDRDPVSLRRRAHFDSSASKGETRKARTNREEIPWKAMRPSASTPLTLAKAPRGCLPRTRRLLL